MTIPRKLSLSVISLILISGFTFHLFTAHGAVSNWQQAANITPKNSTDLSSENTKQSLRDLAQTGANHVTFVIYYYQDNIRSSTFKTGTVTPTDQSLVDAIKFAKSLGLNASLKIHIDSLDGRWRGEINPTNKSEWFKNYKTILMKYANIGAQNGVSQMIIGTELRYLSSSTVDSNNTSSWNDIISSIRSVFNGTLTYSAQWSGYGPSDDLDEKYTIGFWDKLDYLGLSAYYPLAENETNPSVESIINSWQKVDTGQIGPLQQDVQKSVLFTEIGFRSVTGANKESWNYWADGSVNPTLQANLYEALFQYWNGVDYFQGIHIWEWETNPNAGGSTSKTYTPQNKPAEQVITNYFGGLDTTPTPTPSPTPTGSPTTEPPSGTTYTSNAAFNPNTPVINQSVAVNYSVKSSSSLFNAIVNLEIYNPSGQKIFQKYLVGQNFSANVSKNYDLSFTPTSPGEYTAKLGIFKNDWNKLYYWNNRAGVVSVSSVQPPSTSYIVDGTANPENVSKGQSVELTAKVSSSNQVTNAIVDVEIINSSGQRVFQKYYTGQTINSTVKEFKQSWTPANTGTYTLHIGVFNSNWTQKYHWESNAATITVGENSSPQEPTGEVVLKVWWPTNGVKLSGTQPFKAVVSNLDLNDYDIFWQVDGGSLHEMADATSPSPHKIDSVNINGWTKKGDNPYTLKFIAKDKNGDTLDEVSLTVYAWIK